MHNSKILWEEQLPFPVTLHSYEAWFSNEEQAQKAP
jgi:hypothetical protein